MAESGKTDGVAYRETVTLRGPDRGGELHCCNPDVLALVLLNRDGRGRATWYRGHGPEACDPDGHVLFVHEILVEKDLSNIDPRLRGPA